MNIKDSYIHNGTAVLKDVKVENSVLKKILAGKDANDAYLGWETVCDLTGIKPKAAGTADKVGHKLTFSGGVTGTWDGSADKTVAIPTKSSWNYDDVYLKLTGNGTTNPLTGTIYIKDVNGIILNSNDKDLNIWEVYGSSGAWASQYGFNLQYTGTGSGNNNDLILWAHNQNSTHVESYRVKQDGTFIFKAAPKVGTNVMYHAGNLTASVIGGLGTLSNNISGNAATATKANSIATEYASANAYRNVFFAYQGDKTKVVYDDDFMYNPSTNTLKIGAGTLTATNYSGNAATATTATTATKIGTSTIGSTTMPVYIKSGAPTAITSFPEAYLSWGGTNTAGSVTPIGMTLSSEHSANRLAFINGNALTFEYSSDAGSTWTDYGYTASIKSQVFTTLYDVPIGRANGSAEYTTNSRTRITLTAQDGTNSYVYTNPRKMLINIASSGGMQVLIEYRTGTNYKNNGAWTTFGTYTLSGWSGWNDIPLILSTLGGGNTQTSNNWQLRLTFIMTSKDGNYPNVASVSGIRIFGENAWTSPSTMATTGHLYSFDVGQNVTFPAKVTATGGFSGNLTGNADTSNTSNRAKFLETFQQNSTTTTYGSQYPIWAQWSDSTNVKLKCTNYTVWTDKATYATTAGSAPASDVKTWAKADTKPSYTGTEVTLSGYSKNNSYTPIASGDTVQAAIAKLEGAINGLEDLLASI